MRRSRAAGAARLALTPRFAAERAIETENRIERTIGLVILAILAIGCALVLRPFFTAVFFALILVIATWPAFDRLQRLLGGRRALAALLMVTLATLVLVVPPALVASSMDYNVAGTIRLLSDLSQRGVPPPPAWVAGIHVIGPEFHDRWQVLAAGGPEAAQRIQAFVVRVRQYLIGAGLSLGNAVVQLILALVTAFFLYRDGGSASPAAPSRSAFSDCSSARRCSQSATS